MPSLENSNKNQLPAVLSIDDMYENWFLEYASYVILERAVPAISDGLKPVQRRIMHAMKEMDDGRFNKVANIIGSTMQYHPHGDASIGDAIVHLGQKGLLITTQGNWGDARTGDSAAAPRYIEARLSKFALEVAFNAQITRWQFAYDGRKKEPVFLPIKFPLLLAQGAEGIAVGLATKIMPHNFCELIKASVQVLKNKQINILPDFPSGGMADFTQYNEGKQGGKIRVRAKIENINNKTLLIREIPFGINTQSLIESVVKANDTGKIKIKKVIDNTARNIAIEIQLAAGQSPDLAIAALYAFTDCEVSISPNACVIIEEKPQFISVNEMLRLSTHATLSLLKRELEILHKTLMEKILFASLEKIFIENRIYRDIEEASSWEQVLATIGKGLAPYKASFYRNITEEDIIKLTEIKIKRISKYNSFQAHHLLKGLAEQLETVNNNLENIIDYSINYFNKLLEKYGKGKERRTQIQSFDTIQATKVAANNAKLYVNRKEGFIGYGLKKDEYAQECSDIDDIITFRKDGCFTVNKIADKVFVGKNILHTSVFLKTDDRIVYNMIYLDAKSGVSRIKRFQVKGITRDKVYDLTTGHKKNKVLYFTENPNGEAEIVTVYLSADSKARNKVFDYDFSELEIKGRNSQGNILSKYPIRKIQLKTAGVSTLPPAPIWYDEPVGKLNKDGVGQYLGKFKDDMKILVVYQNGEYELTNYEIANRYDTKNILLLEKFKPKKPLSVIYYEGKAKVYYIKRFRIETTTLNKRFLFISNSPNSKLILISTQQKPVVEVQMKIDRGESKKMTYHLDELVDTKGWRAMGNKLPVGKLNKIILISPDDPIEEENVTENAANKKTGKNEKEQLVFF